MGYKLAGYDVIGNVEIDPRVLNIYKNNLHPKYPYLMDVRDFLKQPNEDLPEDLFALDILDGSPPCSVFSSAGEREKGWNKEKKFREGQAMQKLDDLFFFFIQIAAKLKPRVVIAENVAGLIRGAARGYVNEIFKAFAEAGYVPQLFLLNAATMGVPQARERVFFVAHRADLAYAKLKMAFAKPPILFGEIRSEKGVPLAPDSQAYELMKNRAPSDRKLSDITKRLFGRASGYTNCIWSDNQVAGTITSGGSCYRMYDGCGCTKQDFVNMQTFPQDYDFGDQSVQYVCGMSVPPVMMAHIAREVYEQWLK